MQVIEQFTYYKVLYLAIRANYFILGLFKEVKVIIDSIEISV